ncbi:unnamed protein product [Lepidochelys kempii]
MPRAAPSECGTFARCSVRPPGRESPLRLQRADLGTRVLSGAGGGGCSEVRREQGRCVLPPPRWALPLTLVLEGGSAQRGGGCRLGRPLCSARGVLQSPGTSSRLEDQA